jgi:hypothetical protein
MTSIADEADVSVISTVILIDKEKVHSHPKHAATALVA